MYYVVANRVPVAPGWEERFEERFRNRAGQVEQQAGFVSMEILKPRSEGAPWVVLTRWENEEAFHNWIGSEDFKAAHRNPLPKEAFVGEGGLEQHEVVISAYRG
jgi:heme oxygenase (mycobilin-producing)